MPISMGMPDIEKIGCWERMQRWFIECAINDGKKYIFGNIKQVCFQSSSCPRKAISPSLLPKRDEDDRSEFPGSGEGKLVVQHWGSGERGRKEQSECVPYPPFQPVQEAGEKDKGSRQRSVCLTHFCLRQWGDDLTSLTQVSMGVDIPGKEVVPHCWAEIAGLHLTVWRLPQLLRGWGCHMHWGGMQEVADNHGWQERGLLQWSNSPETGATGKIRVGSQIRCKQIPWKLTGLSKPRGCRVFRKSSGT